MHKKFLFVLGILLFSSAVFVNAGCSKKTSGTATSSVSENFNGSKLEEGILYYTNQFRKSKGLPPLQLSEVASVEANRHSRDMANGRMGFGHAGFDERIRSISKAVGRISSAAENVAYGQMNARSVVDGWIKSPPHRRNMLGDYSYVGIGTARGRGGLIYFTEIFYKK